MRWCALLALVALLLTSCLVAASGAVDVSGTTTTSGATLSEAQALADFIAFARRLIRLPFESSASKDALELVREFRSSPAGVGASAVPWDHIIGRLYIPLVEARAFPDALDQMRERPQFRESTDKQTYDIASEEEDEFEGILPTIFRANIFHVLAIRGFDEALDEVITHFGASDPARLKEAVNAGCTVEGTLRLDEVSPLHLLSLYVSDAEVDEKGAESAHGNVATAQRLLAAGANFSAECQQDTRLTPLILAAERGHIRLLSYYLTSHVPAAYTLSPDEVSRTPSEQSEMDEWRAAIEAGEAEHRRQLETGEKKHNETIWQEFLAWADETRPRTAQEKEADEFEGSLSRALRLSAISNQLAVVRRLFSGPPDASRLRRRVNERAFDGRGDCLLHGTVVHGLLEMTQVLLANGADPTILSHDGLTVRQLAVQYRQPELIAFLDQHLRKVKPPVRTRKVKDTKTDAGSKQATSEKKSVDSQGTDPQEVPAPAAAAASTEGKSKYQLAKEKRAAETAKAKSPSAAQGEKKKRTRNTPTAEPATDAATTARGHEEL